MDPKMDIFFHFFQNFCLFLLVVVGLFFLPFFSLFAIKRTHCKHKLILNAALTESIHPEHPVTATFFLLFLYFAINNCEASFYQQHFTNLVPQIGRKNNHNLFFFRYLHVQERTQIHKILVTTNLEHVHILTPG